MDVVRVPRLARLLGDHPGAQAELFTASELAYCHGKRRRIEHLAARFAAKEAVLKAFGTGLGPGMHWTDIEVWNSPLGRPRVRLRGVVADRALARGVSEVDVSLTHTGDLAMAHAIVIINVRRDSCGAEHRVPGKGDDDALLSC